MHKGVKTLSLILLIGPILVVAPPAQAADNAVCAYTGQLAFKPGLPGLMSASRSANYSSRGLPAATMDCQGTVKGHQITGPGTLLNRGVIAGNCAEAAGKGRYVAVLPTDGGTMRVAGKYTFESHGAVGIFSGSVWSGVFEFVAESGDCATSPVTRVTTRAQGPFTA